MSNIRPLPSEEPQKSEVQKLYDLLDKREITNRDIQVMAFCGDMGSRWIKQFFFKNQGSPVYESCGTWLTGLASIAHHWVMQLGLFVASSRLLPIYEHAVPNDYTFRQLLACQGMSLSDPDYDLPYGIRYVQRAQKTDYIDGSLVYQIGELICDAVTCINNESSLTDIIRIIQSIACLMMSYTSLNKTINLETSVLIDIGEHDSEWVRKRKQHAELAFKKTSHYADWVDHMWWKHLHPYICEAIIKASLGETLLYDDFLPDTLG